LREYFVENRTSQRGGRKGREETRRKEGKETPLKIMALPDPL